MIKLADAFKFLPRVKAKSYDVVVMCLWANPTLDQLKTLVEQARRVARHNVIIETVASLEFHQLCVLCTDLGLVFDEVYWMKWHLTNPMVTGWRPANCLERILVIRNKGRESFYRPVTSYGDPVHSYKGFNAAGTRLSTQTWYGPNVPDNTRELLGLPKELKFRPQPTWLLEQLFYTFTPPGGHILEVGAGSGSGEVAAKHLGFSYTGIEIDRRMVEASHRRELPSPEKDVDRYMTNLVTQHNNKYAEMIRRREFA